MSDNTLAYATNLQSLFNDSDGAHIVNPLFLKLGKPSTSQEEDSAFAAFTGKDAYLKNIGNIIIQGENPVETQNMRTLGNAGTTSLPILPTAFNITSSISNMSDIDIKVSVQRNSTLTPGRVEDILNRMTNTVGVTRINQQGGIEFVYDFAITESQDRDDIAYHSRFREYLEVIMRSITEDFFYNARQTSTFTNVNTNTILNNYDTALGYIAKLFGNRDSDVYTSLVNNLKTSIVYAYNNKRTGETSTDETICRDFRTGTDAFTSSFYYILRKKMVDTYRLPENVFPVSGMDGVAGILRKILVDMFLKTQAPYVQYMYMVTAMDVYKTNGDFINYRWGAISQIKYVYLWMKEIAAQFNSLSTSLRTTARRDMLGHILETFKQYTTVTNENFNSPSRFGGSDLTQRTADIIHSLRDKSRQVDNDSKNLYQQQQTIKTAQLSLRNTNEGLKEIKNTYFWSAFQFYTLLLAGIIIIIVGAVLIVLQKELWVLNGSMTLIVLLLLLALVKMIFVFFF